MAHECGESDAHEHYTFVNAIYGVVQVVSVNRTLLLADTGKCAVERVAIPVYEETEATEP